MLYAQMLADWTSLIAQNEYRTLKHDYLRQETQPLLDTKSRSLDYKQS